MPSFERCILPSSAELLDRLSINQIKEIFDAQNRSDYAMEMKKIEEDLDRIFSNHPDRLNSQLIRLVIALAQINLHIWKTKETMQNEPEQFQRCMKLAHQINGIRNQLKNSILNLVGDSSQGAKKTNDQTDNLEGWDISVLSSDGR